MSNEGAHHILSVLVQNRPGVLARVAGLFARRGYNIFSLAVAPAEDEGFSRITIVVDLESTSLEQVVKQLFKLIEVVKISELDPNRCVERELLLATVRTTPDQRFNEWNVGVERALRLPGKGELDRQLGAAGIASAQISRGDALHEASRMLLSGWFEWLRERAAAEQWSRQRDILARHVLKLPKGGAA